MAQSHLGQPPEVNKQADKRQRRKPREAQKTQ